MPMPSSFQVWECKAGAVDYSANPCSRLAPGLVIMVLPEWARLGVTLVEQWSSPGKVYPIDGPCLPTIPSPSTSLQGSWVPAHSHASRQRLYRVVPLQRPIRSHAR
jgi:hypothetical protein